MENFIRTKDAYTAQILRDLKFKEIKSGETGVFMFINHFGKQINFNKDLNEEKIDKKNIHYTNMMCM